VRYQVNCLLFFLYIAGFYAKIVGMSTTPYPRLSVSLSVFTSFDSSHPNRPAAAQVELGEGAHDDFGMGLFVLTRKSNEAGAYQVEPTGKRVIPSSLVLPDEQLEDTADRILVEELGLDVSYRLRQNRIFDELTQGDRQRVISLNFWTFVHIDALAPLLGGRDQVGLEQVSSLDFLADQGSSRSLEEVDGISRFGYRIAPELPNGHQKFLTEDIWGHQLLDDGSDAKVFYAWRDLRYGFTGRYDPFRFIGSHALGQNFRLSELRELYEVIRGGRFQSDQFRRMVTGTNAFVREAGSTDTSGSRPGKPAALFTLMPWATPKTGYQPE
jgi:ADP-ribose pyrophosphatase YjhB (NUDIX family)